ncbi:hypothetical protein [Kribbella amoyensis]|uniref:hypothetical protein n=1 Tax=Kribbella amoyensis TaxID=996641 RepID=UPI001EE35978|nr:hypothetical protein [Kribbella amoyensis]
MRAYPPMIVWFAAALAGLAVVFDVFYLVASPGPALAAVYAVPVLAGVVAGLVAAAEDLELDRRVLVRTIVAAVALGITNLVVVAMISAIRRTDPSNWAAGGQAVLLAALLVLSLGFTSVVLSNLIGALGIELRTHRRHRKPVPAPVAAPAAAPKPRASKEAAARAKPVQVVEERYEPDPEPFVPPPPRVVDLEEPREVVTADPTAHADRRLTRGTRAPVVPPSRRPHRPGRRPGR